MNPLPSFHPLPLRRLDGTTLLLSPGKTAIMGILNITPDSFSDGGKYLHEESALHRAYEMVQEGADLIDIGAESTRPFSEKIPSELEWKRLEKVLFRLTSSQLPCVLSMDTRNITTAHMAGASGVRILNLAFPQEFISQKINLKDTYDLSSFFDAVILMHSRGTPKTMSTLCQYSDDLIKTLVAELTDTSSAFSKTFGIPSSKFIYDPGLGFAKNAEQSSFVLSRIKDFQKEFGHPVLVGASRKSFLGQLTGLKVEDRLAPSLAAALWALQQGSSIVRVHDVKETRAALTLWEKTSLLLKPAEHLSYTSHEHRE